MLLRALTLAAGLILVGAWLRPRFARVRERVGHLVTDLREYGFSIYIGRVMSTGTYNMDILLVAAFADSEAVAFYALGRALAYGVSLPATGASSATFARMAALDRLPRHWLTRAVAVEGAAVIALAVIASPLIHFAYGPEFTGAVGLVVILGVAEAIRGITTFFNSFLNAHGRGRAIRRAGVVFTVTNIVASLALIPPFGATGAAWASLIAMAANLAVHVRGYDRPERAGAQAA
jgi:O-antigen/teichoic acid export membrane protein